ncbi:MULTISPECIES: hypothetical protein [unclassified Streptomyces]|uniref:hypothetical protein n=1 Tax=unclassified Streptomyces TaxID=2593676 RepID=UPI00324FEA03
MTPSGEAESIGVRRAACGPVAGRAARAADEAVLAVLLARRCRCGGLCRTCHNR